MKMKLITLLTLFAGLALAAPKYGNVLTGKMTDVLSKVMPQHIQNATPDQIWEQRKSEGEREVVQVAQPDEGYRVGEYGVIGMDAETCRLAIKSQINLARENADQTAQAESNRLARIAWEKQVVSEKVDNDPLEFAIGFYLLDCMVSNRIAATRQAAKQLILDKAYSKISTNAP